MTPTTKSLLLSACLASTLGAQSSHWTRFAEFHAVNDSLTMRWPSIVTVGDTTIVAVNVFPSDAQGPSGRRRLAIVRAPGGPLPLPQGNFTFAHPQIVVGSRGTLHLVWSEARDSVDTLVAWSVPPASLWHSSYRAGTWSKPRQLLTGRFLSWPSDGRPVVADRAGRVHVVVPGALTDGELAIVYLRVGSADTVEQELHWAGGSYASLTALGGDSILVAYSTADSLTPRRGSAVLVRVSGNGGRSWASPIAISRSGRRNVSPPVVERSGSALHVLWVEESAAQNGRKVVRAFTSRAPFAQWVETATAMPVRGFPVRIVSAGTRCGGYTAIVEFLENPTSDPRMRLSEFFVRKNQLVESEVFPQLETAANVAIAPIGDSLRIVLSVVRPREKTVVNATATGRACGTT